MSTHVSCNQRMLTACSSVCVLLFALACRHQVATSPAPTSAQGPAELAAMEPDQENTAGRDKAWTNLLNDAEQSFTPSLPRLVAVDVELVVGNPGASEDQLTLTVLDATGQTLAVVEQNVQPADSDHVTFMISKSGIEVSPGQTYRLKLSGGVTFGWKYVVGGYENGEATFNGKPHLSDARSTFLFRTFGEK